MIKTLVWIKFERARFYHDDFLFNILMFSLTFVVVFKHLLKETVFFLVTINTQDFEFKLGMWLARYSPAFHSHVTYF